MIKKLIAVLFIAVVLFACGTSETGKTGGASIAINDFDKVAGDYVGKMVTIEGTVGHVCQHGGKRMFVFANNPDIRVKVVPDDNVSSFDVSLAEKDVVVEGIVEELRMDEKYLNDWEAEAKAEDMEAENTDAVAESDENETTEEVAETEEDETLHNAHAGGKGEKADMGKHVSAQSQIDDYRKQIAATEKGYLSFYSIKCTKYSVKDN